MDMDINILPKFILNLTHDKLVRYKQDPIR